MQFSLGTPLWRNGPPEKPVLCNACGSRWRTKGTLLNYTPLHARAEPEEIEDKRTVAMKSMSLNTKDKEVKLLKRKQEGENLVIGGAIPDYGHNFQKGIVDEDTSNRSSSGSAVSNSESCAQFGGPEGSDLTGPAQSVVWDTMVPSRKRTCVNRPPKQSPVEKLTRDLYTILQEQQSSCFSGTSEEDLLLESETPMVSVEIGHGSVLFRHPNEIVREKEHVSLLFRSPKSVVREEESEASSLSVENKLCRTNDVYSLPIHKNSKGPANAGAEIFKGPPGHGMEQGNLKREKSQHEKGHVLSNRNSPLCHVDLSDVANFEEFATHLSYEEQQQLSKLLPAIDVSNPPESLKEMFGSLEFKENLTSFQQLLAEGVFDVSLSGEEAEDYKALRKLALFSSAKCKWVELRYRLKEGKSSSGGPRVIGPQSSVTSKLGNGKRSEGIQRPNYPDVKVTTKNPKKVAMKGGFENKEGGMDSDSSCFSPKNLFAVPSDGNSFLLHSLHPTDENSEQDLLLDVPSNSSFPQAELLHPSRSLGS
ncbi:GATA transcription factor 26 isoform X2 [Punica granatum]|uniref:GATA transcription factor 26 isoform X2 n=1 Tax=Punica granatum TaxID=22663 RepID=A0A6P8D4G7_PUNGR|nr:GATA transcription factor 26 isoform X2 [Punica granatum]